MDKFRCQPWSVFEKYSPFSLQEGSRVAMPQLPPIEFRMDGMPGIRLFDALSIPFNGLDDCDDLMFADGGIGISFLCRIDVCGSYHGTFQYH